MKNNMNNKELEINIDNNSTINKPAGGANPSAANSGPSGVIRDLSKNTSDKPWFKKKSSIIGMGSTLGAGVLATVIAVPVALTSTSSSQYAEISGVVNVYNLTTTSSKLVISGTNLPKEKEMYSVANITTARAVSDIAQDAITITWGTVNPETPSVYDIYLDFVDPSLVAGTIYQVTLKNGNVVSSKLNQNIAQPMFTITTQPKEYTISTITPDKVAVFSIAISTITDPITGEVATYQWQSASKPSTLDSDWTSIPGATNISYSYDAIDLFEDERKYFRCIVSYKYATPIKSDPGFVLIVSKPTISIIDQPMSVNLPFTATSTTLTINASIINDVNSSGLTYQWQESTKGAGGPYENIAGQTNASYTFTNAANIIAGTKKYFKCIVSSVGLEPLISNVVYVGKNAEPILTFTKQIGNIDLPFNINTTILSVTVSIDVSIEGQTLTYQWYESTSIASDATWTKIQSATERTYSASSFTPDVRKYFKCEVTYNTGNTITSNFGSVARLTPVISFSKEIGNVNISNTGQHNVTLSIEATIANQIAGQTPTYQWYEYDNTSDSSDTAGTAINGATSSSYPFNGSSLAQNGSKYFRCKVSYTNATAKFSPFGSVSRKTSWININTQPRSQMISTSTPTATVTVDGVIMYGDSANLRYQWFKSTVNPGVDGSGGSWTEINGATQASYTATIGSTEAERTAWPNTWYRCTLIAANISGTVTTNPVFIKVGLSTPQATDKLTQWFTSNKSAEQTMLQNLFTNMTSAQRYQYYRYINDGIFESIPDTTFTSITPITIRDPRAPDFNTYTIKLKVNSNVRHIRPSDNFVFTLYPGYEIEFVLLFSFTGNLQLVKEKVNSSNFVLNFSPSFSTSGDVNKTSLAWTYDTFETPTFGNYLKSGLYPMKVNSESGTVNYLTTYLIDFAIPVEGSINNTKYTNIPTYNTL